MFVTHWISPTKIQKISEITNFFRHYFLSRTEVKMSSDMEVLEWNVNIPYAERTTMGKFLDDSKGENDVTTSYSLTSFILGIGQGGVVNYQPKPNYILISKNSL